MVVKKIYTNEELAIDYFRIDTIYTAQFNGAIVIKRAIENSNTNIYQMYQEHRNLNGLGIRGLRGSKAARIKKILESILKKSVEETESIISRERIKKIVG